ncbi:MAG TPA: prephenate dehydratase [Elusimicrobia bacterium]|jgi:chorismate mutase/prephenate dehydratase|nr:prephenate dehydratase [Elusimicrobiota bacterium]
MELKKLRNQVDTLDSKILQLLNQRAKLVKQIGKIKSLHKKQYYAPEREREILSQIIKNNQGPLSSEAVKEIFSEILHTCRSLEKKLKIAYLGPEATFTHQAAIKNFGKSAEYISAKSISDVFAEVEKERADYGVVPIENSTEGVENHTLDMFIESDLKICAETLLEISHYLLSREENLQKIKCIYSHPQALAQCRNWLEDHLPNAELIETASTAGAAQKVKKESTAAAIASDLAAELYGLKIVASRIEDRSDNFTRFLVISKNFPAPSGMDKTSILFSIKDRIGALHDMLVPFKKNNINLTKIESRPTKKKAWEYIFFVDFAGHIVESKVKKALNELEEQCLYLKILGSYPRAE